MNIPSNPANFIPSAKGNSVEELNEKYKRGYRLDIEAIEKNKPEATHVGWEYFKLVKKQNELTEV